MPSHLISRRQAIRMVALGGLALGVGLEELHHLIATSAGLLTRVHETRLLMGTLTTLTILSDRPDAARAAIDAAFARMGQLEQVLSRYLPSSQVSCLNRTGSVTGATPDLCSVLQIAVAYSELTSGAFDITVGPLLVAYRASARQGQVPDYQTLKTATALVDYRQVRQQGNTVTLGRSGMAITLDGLAKGYVLDAGADELLRHGYADILVEAGGDLIARGMTDQGGWRIGIEDPQSVAADLLGVLKVENAAVATSGSYRNQFTDADHHHIVNPHTGISPTLLSSVTVLAPTACDADALSTALMVMEPNEGMALAQRRPQVQVLMADGNNRLFRSEGFPPMSDPA